MIESTQQALIDLGLNPARIQTERFTVSDAQAAKVQADVDAAPRSAQAAGGVALTVMVDGKAHEVQVGPEQFLLDAALEAGLDLPYSCKGGVCCTCRCKVLQGQVRMERNFTLQADEMAKGFVLSCQARALTPSVVLSYDER
jgi:ring-1,2-phenylacetyl-CoA epoxidase subunit PaaE